MLTISQVKNSKQAASYYEQADDYYSESGNAPTQWFGQSADKLGLTGAVNTNDFKSLLEGRLPTGEKMFAGSGGKEHRAGWDLTFSAPKSISIMALVAQDGRLIKAHEEAVKAVLAKVEKELIQTRNKNNGEISLEKTGNMITATFRHETNRSQEPQLHTHSIILNLTQRHDGQWRALESRDIFKLQKTLGERYRQELARQVVKLGYEIYKKEGKHASLFEIAGVSQELIDRFSSRSKAVELELEKQGLNRESATAKQKDTAAVNSRDKKKDADHQKLKEDWQKLAQGHDLQKLIKNTKTRSKEPGKTEFAQEAVANAIEKLAERDSVFSSQKLTDEALRFGLGKVSTDDIQTEIHSLQKNGILLDRSINNQPAFTTQKALEIETRLIQSLKNAKGKTMPLMSELASERLVSEIAKESAVKGMDWNTGQINATRSLLSSFDRIDVVQGYAGTAKTTTVLKTAAEAYRAAGYEVRAMAPTHAAVSVLSEAINAPGITVQKSIIELARNQPQNNNKRLWILDEASLLGTKQMAEVVRQAERYNAKLILVGDTKQLASLEAGAAFRQVQEHIQTNILDQIVRQKNVEAKTAVEQTLQNNLTKTFEMVDQVGGVIELKSREQRIEAISEDYLNLTHEQREKTLVIAPGRDDRELINQKIRAKLIGAGEVAQNGLLVETLQSKNLTKAESKDASNYSAGDAIKFLRDYEKNTIKKGSYFKIIEADQQSNTLKLESSDGRLITVNPRLQTNFESYSTQLKEFAPGDKVMVNQTNQNLKNGDEGFIKSVHDNIVTVTINKEEIKIDIKKESNRHLDYAYSSTAHKAQGKTVDRVIVHAESQRNNLINQKSVYVALSRARSEMKVYTDNRESLVEKVQDRKAEKDNAIEYKY